LLCWLLLLLLLLLMSRCLFIAECCL
jgi:hypothetical protein